MVSQLKFELSSLQNLVFQRAIEIRCSTCYKLFTPNEFSSHTQCQNQFSQSLKKQTKQKPQVQADKVPVQVTALVRRTDGVIEITIQADLPERVCEFNVERKLKDVIGFLKTLRQRSGDEDAQMLMLTFIETHIQPQNDPHAKLTSLQLEKLLNKHLKQDQGGLMSMSRLIKSFLSVTSQTFTQIDEIAADSNF